MQSFRKTFLGMTLPVHSFPLKIYETKNKIYQLFPPVTRILDPPPPSPQHTSTHTYIHPTILPHTQCCPGHMHIAQLHITLQKVLN